MGLFDFGGDGGGFAGGQFGGGLDMDQLLQMINPLSPAQAAGAPQGQLNPVDLMNSGVAKQGIQEEAANQSLQSLIQPGVGNASPTPPGAVAGIPLPQPRPQIATERGQPTQVSLGDVDASGRPLGPTVPQPSVTTPPVPAEAPQLAYAPAPPIRALPNVGTPANQLDVEQNAAEGTSLVAKKPQTDDEVGASLTGNKTETEVPQTETVATAPKAEETTDFSSKNKASIDTLAKALRGVQSPAAPAVQRISSPNAPRPTGTIKGGELQALLMALNAAGGGKGPVLGRG